jgi:hypothetical protein
VPHIFNLGTRSVWVISFTLLPLKLPRKACLLSIEDSMCLPQYHYRHCSAEGLVIFLPEVEAKPPNPYPIILLINLFWFQIKKQTVLKFKVFWQGYVLIDVTPILDIFQWLRLKKPQHFGEWICHRLWEERREREHTLLVLLERASIYVWPNGRGRSILWNGQYQKYVTSISPSVVSRNHTSQLRISIRYLLGKQNHPSLYYTDNWIKA